MQGAHAERFGIERPERTPTQAEMREAQRGGLDSKEAKAIITGLWRTTDNGAALYAALQEHGWELARGDKTRTDGKPYLMLIDPQGGTHELRRRVEGVKAAEIYTRMDAIDAATLPSIEQARMQQLERSLAQVEKTLEQAVERAAPEPERGTAPHEAEAAGTTPAREEKPLGRMAGEIHLAYTLSQNGQEFVDGAEERGIR